MDSNEFIIRYIPKKHGYRKIITYKNNSKVKDYHFNIQKILYKRILPSKFSKGFIKNRSIISNAQAHLYNDIFISIDIKNFFSSINHNKLIDSIEYEFNKGRKKIHRQDCIKIVNSCSISNRGLGTGLILSPMLSNIYLKEFDNILYGKLKKFELDNVIYTRYADDMTISFRYKKDIDINIIKNNIIKLAEELLKRYGLKLNQKKTRIINLNISNHVKITGLNIIKLSNNYRIITVGRKRKSKLYFDSLKILNNQVGDENVINRVKGLQSFILSVEGAEYENCYSKIMMEQFVLKGFGSLKEFIDSL